MFAKAALSALVFAALAASSASASPKHCPPGHAKKGWCGGDYASDRAYERGYRDGRRDAYRVGDYIDRDRYVVLDHRRYGYRAPSRGEVYVRIDRDVFLIAAGTGLILAAILD